MPTVSMSALSPIVARRVISKKVLAPSRLSASRSGSTPAPGSLTKRRWSSIAASQSWAATIEIHLVTAGRDSELDSHQPDLFEAAGARRKKLSPLIDRINDRYGRCAIGFGLFPPDVRAFKGYAAFQRVPESWEF